MLVYLIPQLLILGLGNNELDVSILVSELFAYISYSSGEHVFRCFFFVVVSADVYPQPSPRVQESSSNAIHEHQEFFIEDEMVIFLVSRDSFLLHINSRHLND